MTVQANTDQNLHINTWRFYHMHTLSGISSQRDGSSLITPYNMKKLYRWINTLNPVSRIPLDL